MLDRFPIRWAPWQVNLRFGFPVTALLLGACAGCGPGPESRLNGGGASSLHPLMSRWTVEYARESGVRVNYLPIGSGGGIRQTEVGILDFGCTDTPLNDEQLRRAHKAGSEVLHIPLVLGGIVPAYNLPGVDEPVRFTGPVLTDIFLGTLTRWDDPRLRELNPGVPLPAVEIAPVHRSDGSGSTYVWAEYLAKVSTEWKERVGVGTSLRWPCGVGQKGNAGVAGHIARVPYSIGYLELAFALQNDIRYGSVRNRAGAFVQASPESVAAAAVAILPAIPDDLRYSLTDALGSGSYPISGTVWVILYARQPAGKGERLVEFLRWVTHDGQRFAGGLHYAPLPAGLVERAEQQLVRVRIEGAPSGGAP